MIACYPGEKEVAHCSTLNSDMQGKCSVSGGTTQK